MQHSTINPRQMSHLSVLVLLIVKTVNSISNEISQITWTNYSMVLPSPKCSQMAFYDSNNNLLWLIGGWDFYMHPYHSSDINILNFTSNEWNIQLQSSMPVPFNTKVFGWTIVENKFYWNDFTDGMIHSYNIDTNTHITENLSVPSLAIKQYPCVTSFGSKYLIIIGGASYTDTKLQIYDFESNKWLTDILSMNTAHYFGCCEVHNEYLYIIGGQNANSFVKTVEKINLSSLSEWTLLSDTLSQGVTWMGSIVVSDHIYIIGGYIGSAGQTNKVEVISTLDDSITLIQHINYAINRPTISIGPHNTVMVLGGRGHPGSYDVIDKIQVSSLITFPSTNPSAHPSLNPFRNPTIIPSISPSQHPTIAPSLNPPISSTAHLHPPSTIPSFSPFHQTKPPSSSPSEYPSNHPSSNPTIDSTINPSHPTNSPIFDPTKYPTQYPTT
eukprot:64532_1